MSFRIYHCNSTNAAYYACSPETRLLAEWLIALGRKKKNHGQIRLKIRGFFRKQPTIITVNRRRLRVVMIMYEYCRGYFVFSIPRPGIIKTVRRLISCPRVGNRESERQSHYGGVSTCRAGRWRGRGRPRGPRRFWHSARCGRPANVLRVLGVCLHGRNNKYTIVYGRHDAPPPNRDYAYYKRACCCVTLRYGTITARIPRTIVVPAVSA